MSNPDEAQGWSVRCVGIPASIDNDIALTGLAIGVDTAMNTIVEACDRIADTASAHDRTFILPAGVGRRSPADPYCYLVDLPAVLSATKELLEGQSPLARWRATAFDDLEDVFLL